VYSVLCWGYLIFQHFFNDLGIKKYGKSLNICKLKKQGVPGWVTPKRVAHPGMPEGKKDRPYPNKISALVNYFSPRLIIHLHPVSHPFWGDPPGGF
jgi:hypothetical protein